MLCANSAFIIDIIMLVGGCILVLILIFQAVILEVMLFLNLNLKEDALFAIPSAHFVMEGKTQIVQYVNGDGSEMY